MSINATGIEWTDFSANPIRARDKSTGKVGWACAKVSDGCKHCYSETINKRFGNAQPYSAQAVKRMDHFLDEKVLSAVLRNRKISGKRVFIGDMTDIFGEWVPFDWLDRLFAVFALRLDVTFQVLTKRPERITKYLRDFRDILGNKTDERVSMEAENIAGDRDKPIDWPLPNVWLGCSVEDQAAADERIPHLLRCPAAIRFLSCEPLLSKVDLRTGIYCDFASLRAPILSSGPVRQETTFRGTSLEGIHWVIVGGESGPGARPCNIEWIRSIVEQCKAASVPVFTKQLGTAPYVESEATVRDWPRGMVGTVRNGSNVQIKLRDRKGGDPSEWAENLRVRQFPEVAHV